MRCRVTKFGFSILQKPFKTRHGGHEFYIAYEVSNMSYGHLIWHVSWCNRHLGKTLQINAFGSKLVLPLGHKFCTGLYGENLKYFLVLNYMAYRAT